MLSTLYADFTTVLRSDPNGASALQDVLLPFNSHEVHVSDILGMPQEESIDAKLAAGAYNVEQGGAHLFFHDLKLSFGRLVGQNPQESQEYHKITELFKFSIDLLMREANRLKLVDLAPDDDDEILKRLSHDFGIISTEMQSWNSETFWITAANGPMFMSAPFKAPVDPRDTVVAGSVHTSKLLPYSSRIHGSTLGTASPLNPRIPQPYLPPTDLLSNFRHPNDSAIVPPLWTTGKGGYSTFAPTSDSNNAVVSSQDAAAVWAAKSGVLKEIDVEEFKETKNEEVKPEENSIVESVELRPEDVEMLLKWSPYSFIDDDELDARSNGKEKELVSSLLLKLEHHQQNRLSNPLPTPKGDEEEPVINDDISVEERNLALKSANILARLVETADKCDIDLKLDNRMPVLVQNYAGSLPAATNAPLTTPNFQQSNRLQTLAGVRNRMAPSLPTTAGRR